MSSGIASKRSGLDMEERRGGGLFTESKGTRCVQIYRIGGRHGFR